MSGEETGSAFLARLQFEPGGPVVEGEWADLDTARGRYTEWVGRYGSYRTAVIELIEEPVGRRGVLKTWTAAHGEVSARHADRPSSSLGWG